MNESLSFIFLCLASFQKCTQIWRYSLEVRAQESKSKQATEREKEKNNCNFCKQQAKPFHFQTGFVDTSI